MPSYSVRQCRSLIWIKLVNIIETLHNCDLFSSLQPAGFQSLASMAHICHFQRGQLVFRENDPCPGVYVVGRGLVRVFKIGPGGREHVLHMVGPGGTFAEIVAIGGGTLPASAEAIKKTSCVLLPLERFRQALADDHELTLGMMAGMAAWVRHLVTLVEDVTLRDAAGRVARFLLESKRDADNAVKLPGLKRHVANHLNLTSETFSRTLRRLVEAGLIIEIDNARVRVLKPRKLRQMADGLFPKC